MNYTYSNFSEDWNEIIIEFKDTKFEFSILFNKLILTQLTAQEFLFLEIII